MDKAELQTDKNKVRHAVDGSLTGAKVPLPHVKDSKDSMILYFKPESQKESNTEVNSPFTPVATKCTEDTARQMHRSLFTQAYPFVMKTVRNL